MAWIFEANCPDCAHHWEGCVASIRLGPLLSWSGDDTQWLFCPRCCNSLSLPRMIDRNRWRLWIGKGRSGPAANHSPSAETPLRSQWEWIAKLLAHINAQLTSGEWYTPRLIE